MYQQSILIIPDKDEWDIMITNVETLSGLNLQRVKINDQKKRDLKM